LADDEQQLSVTSGASTRSQTPTLGDRASDTVVAI
jgi:hypothetical protein